MIHPPSPRSWLRGILAAVLAVTVLAGPALAAPAGAEPADGAFAGEARVTAVDLVVELRREGRDRVGDSLPRKLVPADFRVTTGGVARRVAVVEPGDEPWTTVLYFDLVLTGASRAARAARDLATVVPQLVARGEVSIVVADPEPHARVAPTRNADALIAALGQLGTVTGADHDLLALRWEAARTLASGIDLDAEAGLDRPELLRRAAVEEASVVRTQLDRLVLALAEEQPPGVRRPLFLVCDGFDQRPAEFYRDLGLPADEPGPDLAAEVAVAARTLAAYGWVVDPVVPPPARALRDGMRIGKWRFGGSGKRPEPEYDPTTAGTAFEKPPMLLGVVGARESERDPKRAAELVTLGRALLAQGKPADAEVALEDAFHHYYSDPRTADAQAETLFLLAEAVEAQGRVAEGRELVTYAASLSPATAQARGVVAARLLAPGEPLATLARETAGAILRGSEPLAAAIDDFARRVRLTYEVGGPPDGELRPLTLAVTRRGWALRYPAWGRSATPDAVAAARVRRLLDGDLLTGELALRAAVSPGGAGLRLAVDLAPRNAGEPAPVLRLSLGRAGPEAAAEVEHRRIEAASGGASWETELPLAADPDRPYLAVVVEDLDRGVWGGALLETPELEAPPADP